MTLGAFEDTATFSAEPIHRAEADRFRELYGVTAWFGHHTRKWWALVDQRDLVEGTTPERLGEAIMAARRRAA
ncbi:hypothetical protein [Actinomadura violacea]|uniref:Uncharacterized protein n=1 Tax=Actinomadura violacea TaxID=2819934 RepID=A0ABS3RIL3_9ACTN|nr:hypothetical protein [Actinomadura violacea]MBO2456547.1 hypothetical protein [Actinomadura violacea]